MRPFAMMRLALRWAELCGLALLLCACAATPSRTAPPPPAAVTTPIAAPANIDSTALTPGAAPGQKTPSAQVKTRNALFKPSSFAELPGWRQDDLDTAWDALLASCKALSKREAWQPICAKTAHVARDPIVIRRFFESEFALFQILNVDASIDGDVTGYYEPLINGSLRMEGPYTVPVYATPNDLYVLNWTKLAPAQRRGTVFVVKNGQGLVVAPSRQAGSYALDTGRFEFDTRDRNWRVQLVGDRAVPYRTRTEIESVGRLDAPVLAYVDDAFALYAMQVQGSGRIRLRDGTVLRLQYAEHNGQTFRPLRVVSAKSERGRARGIASGDDEAETFELADSVEAPSPDADEPTAGVTTRGLKSGTASGDSSASDAIVEQLLRGAQRPQQPKAATRPTRPATAPLPRQEAMPTARPAAVQATRKAALSSDPSYVFFRVAPDQSPTHGPVGALGVPLTAGRSIAVDPRVTPLGYPVYLSAPTPAGATLPMQRLVVAQDTGAAIRGAIRADFFWGFGADAGRQAMRTKQRGRMWLMLPQREAGKLLSSKVQTRGVGSQSGIDSDCLVADDDFCAEPE